MIVLIVLGILSTTNAQLIGGWTELTDKATIQTMSSFAMSALTAESGSNKDYSGCVVVHSEKQLVAGMNYHFVMKCPGEICNVTVYDVPWMHSRTLSSHVCAKRQTRVGGILAGGVSAGCPDDNTIQAAMPAVLQRIDGMSNSLYKVMPVTQTVTDCTKQVVAGMKYSFTLTVHDSTCTKYDTKSTLAECPITDHQMSDMKFHATIVSQPWMNPAITVLDVQPKMAQKAENKKHGHKLHGNDYKLKFHGKGHKVLLGGDNHDLIHHGYHHKKHRHDMVHHGRIHLLGGDTHDMVLHGKKPILGGDTHDMVHHGKKPLLGGDTHDMVHHGKKPLLGGDTHDMVHHGKKPLLGGDTHDMVHHGKKPLLGGDTHDMVHHGKKPLLGGDGHDKKKHGQSKKKENLKLLGDFKEFQKKYNKKYKSKKEQQYRFKVFQKNMRTAKKLQQTEKGTAVYGATQFADLTVPEFKQYVGKRWDINAKSFVEMEKAHVSKSAVPEAFDWRDHGAVTPVKNQGSCGSCWAFSTTGNIEGQWAIKQGNLLSLSEQELVDCDKIDEGCNGGLPSNAYKEIERLGGLETESQYKYDGQDEKCEFKKSKVKAYINGSVSISSDEKEMAAWLAKNGPISIGINAFAMQFYMGGISYPWRIFCNPKNLDHGVLIVGYGVEGSKPYWIIKNSWGASWGEEGYYRAYRGAGVCGLNTMCTSSVIN